MAQQATLQQLMGHFSASTNALLVSAGDALAKGDRAAFERVRDRITNSKVVENITAHINSSRAHFDAFVAKLSEAGKLWDYLKGAIGVGVGGGMLSSAVGLAAAIGISVLAVKVIAIALILWGLYQFIPRVFNTAVERIMGTLGLGD